MQKDKPMGFASSSSLLLLLLSLASFCVSNDQLSPARPLVFPDDKLISNNGFFALGLFSPTNSSTRFYVGIWYNIDPERMVVWVANRNNPITTSSASSSTTLAVTNWSELVLSDRQGRIYWTTTPDTGGADVVGASATLLNEGNLVLQSSNGTILWQSFDHPTDTILSAMTIRMNYRTHFTTRLVSWKSYEDPSTGDVSFTGDASSDIQFFVWHGSNISWRSPPLNRLTAVKSYQPRDSNWIVITSIVVNGDEISMTYSVPDGSPAMHMHGRISYSGRYEFRIWNSTTSLWTVALVRPGPGCDGYALCGPFSYCNNTEAVPTCKCPDGFEPNGRTMSGGCVRKEPLRCGKDRFVILKDVKTPAMPVFVRRKSFDGCTEECLGNCSCTAYAYTNLTNAISEGDQSWCLLWFGELLDVGKFGELDERQTTSDDLYLRLAGPGSTAKF